MCTPPQWYGFSPHHRAAMSGLDDSTETADDTEEGDTMAEIYAAQSVGASYCASCAVHIPTGLVMLIEDAREYCPVCARATFAQETRERAIAALITRIRLPLSSND